MRLLVLRPTVNTGRTTGASGSPDGNGTHTRVCKHNASHAETKDCTFSAASCAEPVACTECGAAYLLGHDWGGWTSNGNKTHTRTCKRDPSHTETQDCGDFREANCTTPAMCQDCGGTYGETAPEQAQHGRGSRTPMATAPTSYTCDYDSSHTKNGSLLQLRRAHPAGKRAGATIAWEEIHGKPQV